MANNVFYILAGISLLSALMAMTLRNLFHCALFWVLAMFGVAGVFLYLDSEFLAAVQVIIYVGAVTVFIFFGIMFTRNVMDERISVMNGQFALALIAAVGFAWITHKAIQESSFRGFEHPLILTQEAAPDTGKTTTLATLVSGPDASSNMSVENLAGDLLLPDRGFAYAFEFVSILLLAALIGAIVVARKEPS
ncbi:MAG TPA: NADH-quinone oxidoreductase subunit J [bacterium]|nr:NADH-quinone oxidoreductase subunit J [bacterium]